MWFFTANKRWGAYSSSKLRLFVIHYDTSPLMCNDLNSEISNKKHRNSIFSSLYTFDNLFILPYVFCLSFTPWGRCIVAEEVGSSLHLRGRIQMEEGRVGAGYTSGVRLFPYTLRWWAFLSKSLKQIGRGLAYGEGLFTIKGYEGDTRRGELYTDVGKVRPEKA